MTSCGKNSGWRMIIIYYIGLCVTGMNFIIRIVKKYRAAN